MASAAVYVLTALLALLAFLCFSVLPLGLSHRPNQVALHYPHFPPLASTLPHFSPLFCWTISRAVAKPPKDIAKPPKDIAKPPKDIAKPPKDIAKPPKDIAKPPQGKKYCRRSSRVRAKRELHAGYLRHERSQHVTCCRAAGDSAQWHHTVFKI